MEQEQEHEGPLLPQAWLSIVIDDPVQGQLVREGEPMPHQIPTHDDDNNPLPKMHDLLGDGLAKSSVAYNLALKDMGSGGSVHVSLSITHNQDEGSAYWAQRIAFCTTRAVAFEAADDMKRRLVAKGLVRP